MAMTGFGGAAHAAPTTTPKPVVVGDAIWTQERIPSTGGVTLYADVLRPKNLPSGARTPVVMSIGPYFSHFTAKRNAVVVDELGRGRSPADRYNDMLAGTQLLRRGYTYVMVDLRGFGGSSGCPDSAGPAEQSDVVSAVRWAASRPWSTGRVGLYGKSYDAVTGLMGAGLDIPGLSAVVAQEPVYDWYRYLYGNGVPRINRLGTPLSLVYMSTNPNFSPPAGLDPAAYVERSLSNIINPGCLGAGLAATLNARKTDAYWAARNLIPKLRGSAVPLFLSQGFIDQNTAASGVQEVIQGMRGPVRAWLGMWDHVRSNDTDQTAPLNSNTPRRLSTGRPGYLDEVARFYDRYLKGKTDAVVDPPFVVQDNTGNWRAQNAWPVADHVSHLALTPGSYVYNGRQTATKIWYRDGYYATQLESASPGGTKLKVEGTSDAVRNAAWTVTAPEPRPVRISGTIQAWLHTRAPADTPIAVDVYDVDQAGNGVLITQNAALLNSPMTKVNLFATDWVIQSGHRLAVRVTDSNSGYWSYYRPTDAHVRLTSGTIDLPIAPVNQGLTTVGDSNSSLDGYLATFRYPVPVPSPKAPLSRRSNP